MRKPPPKSRFAAPQPPAATERRQAAPGRPAHQPAGKSEPAHSSPRAQLLYGVHPVTAAWLNPERRCLRLYGTTAALAEFAPTIERAKELGLKRPGPTPVERDALERLLPPGAVHQGIVLDAEPLPEQDLADLLIAAGDGPATMVLLDQLTDPHNIGAILRSAAAFGAIGMIVHRRHSPEITGVMAKAASGAIEIVPMVRETNLARAIESLREAGYFVVGLDEAGTTSLTDAAFGARVVLVLGAEGAGLRRLVAEGCDLLARLPTKPPIGSLNVSNAAAVGLYEITRRLPPR